MLHIQSAFVVQTICLCAHQHRLGKQSSTPQGAGIDITIMLTYQFSSVLSHNCFTAAIRAVLSKSKSTSSVIRSSTDSARVAYFRTRYSVRKFAHYSVHTISFRQKLLSQGGILFSAPLLLLDRVQCNRQSVL